ncbi:SpoIIE family protein phosphatase [Nonomuraea jiangxiensis]|nr:SpoIIE family protein phosphatase [Nonomuraea jiangxiensis]
MPLTTAGGGAEETHAAIAVIDDTGTVIGWSRAAEDLLGYRAADVIGRSGAALLTTHDRAARIAAWAHRFGDQEHWSGLTSVLHRDGRAILTQLEGSRLRIRDGTTSWLLAATPFRGGVAAISALEPLIRRSPVAVGVWDADLRCVWLNEMAQRLRRVFPHYQVGRSLAELLPGPEAELAVGAMRAVLADGIPLIDRESRWTTADGRSERTLTTSLFRLEGRDGQALGVCSLAMDITDSPARERLALLRQVSTRVGTTLDVSQTAQELADLAVPVLGDYVTVDLNESVLPNSEVPSRPPVTEAGIPVFRRAGAASIHPGIPESPWARGEVIYVPPTSPFTRVLASGRSHFEPVLDASPGTWVDYDPQRARTIRDAGIHTLIIVPLRARGDILGVTVFIRTENPTPFTLDDLDLAEEFVARAALSLDNALRYTRERTAALALQRNLLPRRLTGGDAVEVASRYLPAGTHEGVGGDWYDAIPLRDGRLALVVGDVTGHGINAAATMGRLRTAVRTLTNLGLPPAELLADLDNVVARMSEQEADTEGIALDAMGATCLYALYDPVTRHCVLATAGHPPPALVAPGGGVTFPRLPPGTPIGLGAGTYESLDLELAAGTLIALYTDGLIETREADLEAGMDRLAAALSPVSLPLDDLCDSVIEAMVADSSEDDVALLLARTRALPER